MSEDKSKKIPDPPKPVEPEIVIQKEVKLLDNGIEVALPSAPDLEENVLGAILIDNKSWELIDLIEPEIFNDKQHRLIMRAIKNLYDKAIAIDLSTAIDELKRMGKLKEAGGDYYLIQLTQKISSSAHIEFHFRILLQKYALREMIFMSRSTMYKSLHRDPDIFQLMEAVTNKIAEIENVISRQKNDESNDAKAELQKRVEQQRKGISPGIPTGIEDFDNWRGGFWERWLVTLAARPGMGKTTAVLSMIYHLTFVVGIPVVFFSLEMTAKDLKYKLAAAMTNISLEKINQGLVSDEELNMINQAIDKIDESALEIVDNMENLDRIVSHTRKKAREGIKIFFLDYLQLVQNGISSENETAQVTKTTRTFKTIKNELNITFVQLSQLSRNVDNRKDHRPQLSDLKMSGSIEEDSNMVIFLYRPEYYNTEKSRIPPKPGEPNPEFIAQWIVAKGRDTGIRDFDIYIDLEKTRMESFSGIHF